MTLLPDKLIKEYGMISPFDDGRLQPASYDLRLDVEFLEPLKDKVNVTEKGFDGICLRPQQFLLASTIENIHLPDDIYARVEGKSSLGRVGLLIHATAGFIDPGFQGNVTLELYNLGKYPIMLEAESNIAQICFGRLEQKPSKVYGECGNHYQGQKGVTGSVLSFNEDLQAWVVK